MSKLLIIGSEGQLGSELSNFLKMKYDRNDIILSDIKNYSNSNLIYEKIDALDKDNLSEVIKDYNIKEVFHLAAILSANGEKDPMLTWNLNMNSLFNVLELAKEKIIKKVFWPSSISVFGSTSIKDNTPQFSITEPSTIYGISKLAGERWCEYYNMKYNTDIRSIRFPGIISSNTLPGGGTTDYAVDIFYSFLENKTYECFLEKDTMLPMIYIDDAIQSIFQLMSANRKDLSINSSYNLSGFSTTPDMMENELKKINKYFDVKYSPDFRQSIAESWPNSIDDLYARKEWDWNPRYDLRRTIKEMITKLKEKNNE